MADLVSKFTSWGDLACAKKKLQAPFPFTNGQEKNIVLSEVSDFYSIDASVSSSLSSTNKLQKPRKAPSLPARICAEEASPRE